MINRESILFLTGAYPDFDDSYRGIFIKKLATLLKERGYQISVVTPKVYKESSFYEEQNGIKIYRFPFYSGNKPLIQYRKVPYFRMVLYYFAGFILTIYVCLKNRCGLIHAHWAIPIGLIGPLIRLLLRIPFVVSVHGSDHRMALERSKIFRKLFLFVCRRAKHVHCVSQSIKEDIQRWGIETPKLSVFPMAVDECFLQVGRNRKFLIRNKQLTVFSNRNLLPLYNVSLFINAIPHVLQNGAKWQFLIAGEGPERENLENQASRLNICSHLSFLGRIQNEKMASLLNNVDIYVSTSKSDGTSVSLLEAMASGAFPIVTNIDSNQKWIVDGDNGFLVPLENEVYLAQKITEAGENMELRKKACEKNIQIIEEWADGRKNASILVGIYEKALQ